jgi:hypothetical protein
VVWLGIQPPFQLFYDFGDIFWRSVFARYQCQSLKKVNVLLGSDVIRRSIDVKFLHAFRNERFAAEGAETWHHGAKASIDENVMST